MRYCHHCHKATPCRLTATRPGPLGPAPAGEATTANCRVCGMLYSSRPPFDPRRADWAGYGDDGNDQRCHLHIHPAGTYIRSDIVTGFRCSAPLVYADGDWWCSDPADRVLALAE